MLSSKDLLISALEAAIANFSVTNEQKRILSFDNTEYNAFLTNFNSPKDITNLTESMIDKLAGNLDITENRQTFVATIRFLKGLAELSQKEGSSLPLNSNQLAVINELKILVEQTIKKNESLIAVYSETSEETNQKYLKALTILNSNELLKVEDYDLIEEVIYKLCAKDNGPMLNDVISFLNIKNANKLKAIYEGNEIEPEDVSEIIETQVQEKIKKKEKHQEELMSKMNVRLAGFVEKSKKKTSKSKGLANIERNQKIKEIFAYLGYDYDKLSGTIKASLISFEDLEELNSFAHYIKDKNPIIIESLRNGNLRALVYILTSSSQLVVEKVLHNLIYVHNLEDENVARVINLMPTVFGAKYYDNFIANLNLMKEYDVNLSNIIRNSLLVLMIDNKQIKNILSKISKYNPNMKAILELCTSGLINDKILKNISILEMYGFDLNSFFKEKESCYILLNSRDLATKLDSLIEVGLNEYIHSSPSFAGNSFRTLIIKRVYYAFKNELKVWDDQNEWVNVDYDELINKSDLIINDSIISLLIAEHPIIELIDDSHRPAIYSATLMALLKRKTELLFANQTISRLKTYRIFKILTDCNIDDKNALLYSLIYQAPVDNNEYEIIKSAVERSGDSL